ncbi:diacylglycerol/lipid kinase family protein [Microbacterium suaedae]|uniref:diacylglycerol/lipid kinase family protein n=1 Tax=Microbacterium suaedae TaxID=2067813 RepID=UPI000DA1FC2E|nr:diacylglycerol kinase family protein [Microbacterium suaedae]
MSQATHIGIVFNPSKGARDELEAAVVAASDATVTWHETEVDDPGVSAAREAIAAGADLVLAAGGDGTVRAVAEHLGESGADVELGIVPLGTGNLLARNLDVPLGDLAAAVERALDGEARDIDLGWADVAGEDGQRRWAFAVMAGFGIDAHMITETDDDLKDKAGWMAYVESLGRAVSASEIIRVTLTFDDGETQDDDAHTLIVGNCGTLQAGFTLLPDADPSDGELDLFVLDAEGAEGWGDVVKNVVWDNGIARAFGGGRAKSSDSVTHRRIASLEIDLAEPRVFEVDGDEIGQITRASISVQPAAIRVR